MLAVPRSGGQYMARMNTVNDGVLLMKALESRYWLNLDIPRASNARTGKYAPTILLMTSWAPVACQYARLTCAVHDVCGNQALCSQLAPM